MDEGVASGVRCAVEGEVENFIWRSHWCDLAGISYLLVSELWDCELLPANRMETGSKLTLTRKLT